MTDTTRMPAAPTPQLSRAAVRAAAEIADKIPAIPVYRQALAEAFAEIIERHTRTQELLHACQQARDALTANASVEAAITVIDKAVAAPGE